MASDNTKTVVIMKEKRQVPQEVKDELKFYNQTKKAILKELKEKPMTIPEMSKALGMTEDRTLFYLMSLVKYGLAEVDEIDDMDEYFYYRIKDNG